MRIEEIHVDGFGLISQKTLVPAPGLTLVRGLNEAGKTSLLAFVRAILFGFETRRYAAMAGGRRGGRLTVRMADDRLMRIERYGERGGQGVVKVLGEDGVDRGSEELARLLQGVDSALYRNVFAFGLAELAAFENLAGKEVSARIYGAGLGLGSVSAVDAENGLGAKAAELFKGGGSTPVINGLLRKLEEVTARLGRDLPEEYAETVRSLKDAEQGRQRAMDEQRASAEDLRRHDRHIKAWPSWIQVRDALAERAQLGTVSILDAGVATDLVRVEARSQEAQDRLVQATEELAVQRRTIEGIRVDPVVLDHRATLEELARDAIRDRERSKQLETVTRDLETQKRELSEALRRLGPDWTEGRVESFDDSVAVETAITGHFRLLLDRADKALAGAEAARAELERAVATLGRDAERLDGEIQAIKDEAAALPPIERLQPAVENLRTAVAVRSNAIGVAAQARATAEAKAATVPASPAGRPWREVARDVRSLQDVMAREEMLASLPAPTVRQPSPAAPSWVPLVIGLGGILVAFVLLALGSPLLAAGALLLGLAGAVLVWQRTRSQGEPLVAGSPVAMAEPMTRLRAQRAGLAAAVGLAPDADAGAVSDLAAQCDRAVRLAEEAEALLVAAAGQDVAAATAEAGVAEAARAAGLPDGATPDAIDALGRQLAEARGRAARTQGLAVQAADVRAQAAARRQALGEASERVGDMHTAQDAAQGEWAQWLSGHGLNPGIDCETAARVVAAVTAAKQPMRTREASQTLADQLRAEHTRFFELVVGQAKELDVPIGGLAPGDQPGLERVLAQLAGLRDAAVAAAGQRDEALRTAGRLEDAGRRAQDDADAAQGALADLLLQQGVPDTAALRDRIAISDRARQLDAVVDAGTTNLQTLSGPGQALERLREELESLDDVGRAEAAYAECRITSEELEARLTGLNERVGELRDAVDRMEKDVAATTDRQAGEDLQARLDAKAVEWATYSVARHVLSTARSAYEAEHRPAVFKTAEAYFREWTAGRYRRIVAPVGSQVQAVEHGDGTIVAIEDLSTGTAQQLYLAIRFGLLEHFAQNAEPLPIVMDDILVNFDNERAALAAKSIADLAARHQVLYFTCHPEVPLTPDLELQLPRLRTVADALAAAGGG